MDEFEIINNYLKPLSKKNSSSINLNDDVFFDKKNKVAISVDTYIEGKHFINFNKPDLVIKNILRSSISESIWKGVWTHSLAYTPLLLLQLHINSLHSRLHGKIHDLRRRDVFLL